MIFAVIPAGGKSSRMGRPKLALPVGSRTVLERVIDALRLGGVEHVLVVIGPPSADLEPLARTAGAHTLLLTRETADMRATVEEGLAWLEQHFHPSPDDAWLLVPADHPTLDPAVIRSLLRARELPGGASIMVPTFQGRRGHPTLIGWKHVEGIRGLPAGTGLNVYLRQPAAEARELPVDCPDILADLDTPEDYENLRRRFPDFI
jgi:molybdenum cofactor cytidylyltransferase